MDDQIDPRKTARNMMLGALGILTGLATYNATTSPQPAAPVTLEQRVQETPAPAQEPAESVHDSYVAELEQQLRTKKRRYKSTPDSTIRRGQELIGQYRNTEPTRMTLEEYIQDIDALVKDTDIDWKRLADTKFTYRRIAGTDTSWHKDTSRLPVTKQVAQAIDGRMMLAYSLTELGGHGDGEANLEELSKTLREKGKEYLLSRMSQWDPYMSYGFCQIKDDAVAEVNRTQGTDLDIAQMTYDEQIQACYRNAVTNLAHGIFAMSDEGFEHFSKHWHERKDALAVVMGAMNFRQADGSQVLGRWAEDGMILPPRTYATGPRMDDYLTKTDSNAKAVLPSAPVQGVPELFTYVGKNSEDRNVFRRRVKEGYTASHVSELFDAYDELRGDLHANTGYDNVVGIKGEPKHDLAPSDTVYVVADEQ